MPGLLRQLASTRHTGAIPPHQHPHADVHPSSAMRRPGRDQGVAQFDELLDEFLASYPVKTTALREADVRFVAGKILLLNSRSGSTSWPGAGSVRLAACLLVLFAENLARSNYSYPTPPPMGMGSWSGLFEVLVRTVREGSVQPEELQRAVLASDLTGNGLQLAQSNELKRVLWAQPDLSEEREGSGSSLPSVFEGMEADEQEQLAAVVEEQVAAARALPTASCLQQLADDHVAVRGQHYFQLLTVGFALLILLSFLPIPAAAIVEVLVLLMVPILAFWFSAAVVPVAPPPATIPFLVACLLISTLASFRIAASRHTEFMHCSVLEVALRCGLCSLFGLSFFYIAARCWASSGLHFWQAVRLATACANVARMLVIVVLRFGVATPTSADALAPPQTYPPGLSFTPALLFAAFWVVNAAAATPAMRKNVAAWTGFTVVSMHLSDICSATFAGE